MLPQNWAQGIIWKLPQAMEWWWWALFLPGCLGERIGKLTSVQIPF